MEVPPERVLRVLGAAGSRVRWCRAAGRHARKTAGIGSTRVVGVLRMAEFSPQRSRTFWYGLGRLARCKRGAVAIVAIARKLAIVAYRIRATGKTTWISRQPRTRRRYGNVASTSSPRGGAHPHNARDRKIAVEEPQFVAEESALSGYDSLR